jgi:hypothetical protein
MYVGVMNYELSTTALKPDVDSHLRGTSGNGRSQMLLLLVIRLLLKIGSL